MARHPKRALQELRDQLAVDDDFFEQCLAESIIEIEERQGRLQVGNGTLLRFRRLQRICLTFEVDLPVALLLSKLRRRVADLEDDLRFS